MARYDLSEVEWRLIEPLLPNSRAGWRGLMIGGSSTASEALSVSSPGSMHLIDSSIIRAHQQAAGRKKRVRITPSAVLGKG